MTPQERQLVSELFDRLEKLERAPRDGDAERAVAEGFDRAPNAAYALVQTVLVQDEALKRANARIEELQAAAAGGAAQEEHGGFLDSMRDVLTGREAGRGSVPSVRPGAAPAPDHGPGEGASGRWNTGGRGDYSAPRNAYEPPPPPPPPAYGGGGGGSFLGTAAASAAGVIGGALLMNSIRGMFGPSSGGHAAAFDPGLSGNTRAPWGGGDASGSDLARDAGLNDIGGGRGGSNEGERHAGLFGSDQGDGSDDNNDNDDGGDDTDLGGDFGGGDSDSV
jgi:uncharacterized protein